MRHHTRVDPSDAPPVTEVHTRAPSDTATPLGARRGGSGRG